MKRQLEEIILKSIEKRLEILYSQIYNISETGRTIPKELIDERNDLYKIILNNDEKYSRILSEEKKPDVIITCPDGKSKINITKIINSIREMSFMYGDGNNAGKNNLDKSFALARDFRFLDLLRDEITKSYGFYIKTEGKI